MAKLSEGRALCLCRSGGSQVTYMAESMGQAYWVIHVVDKEQNSMEISCRACEGLEKRCKGTEITSFPDEVPR